MAGNTKAQLSSAYAALADELSTQKVKVVGNYTLGKVIGEGTFGRVRIGTHRLTGTRVAIKQIPKALSAQLTREIHHHRRLHHPHVTQLYEVIATESYIWLVTELCSGGELYDYLVEKGRLSENEARSIFGQLCLALNYVHELGVVHRDLKLENVLLDEHCRVKLSDFGFTREFEKGALLETFCGTTGYASPEMLLGKKYTGEEVDIWSLGIILFALLTGTLPFDDDDEAVMKDKIVNGIYEDPEWLSASARDLLKAILQQDPTKRPSLRDILKHPWFSAPSKPVPESASRPRTPPNEDVFGSPLDAPSRRPSIEVPPLDVTSRLDEKGKQRTVDPQTDDEAKPKSAPPQYPTRTPIRTKRRSVSSTISPPSSPTTPAPPLPSHPDFIAALSNPAPIVFSTPLERELLNGLSALGFDTAQIVHSVLSDACDATGAIWWMLKKKRSVMHSDSRRESFREDSPMLLHTDSEDVPREVKRPTALASSTSLSSAPDLALLPPTPVIPSNRPVATQSLPAPTSSSQSLTVAVASTPPLSTPSSPSKDVKDKEKRNGKPRAGSVSMLQRATTVLGAGLVRKKSDEPLRDKKEDRKANGSPEGSGGSRSSGPNRLTKSPPVKAKDPTIVIPELNQGTPPSPGSQWVLASHSPPLGPAPTPANSPGDTLSQLPSFAGAGTAATNPKGRNRASLLNAFRTWFREVDGRKRKSQVTPSPSGSSFSNHYPHHPHSHSIGHVGYNHHSLGRATMGRSPLSRSEGKARPGGKGHREKRPSVSSRRSSSVNSRRSSMNSVKLPEIGAGPPLIIDQMVSISRQRSDASRRSYGSRTPNSERGDYPSRPSSSRSFTTPMARAKKRHSKSPSNSSAGSTRARGTASPLQRYHQRAGSGSSTRVIRQLKTVHSASQPGSRKPSHVRSSSATSSIHSRASSRPGSFHEGAPSEGEAPAVTETILRTGSPFGVSRRSSEERRAPYSATVLVAHKKSSAFTNPSASINRSSWKKAWGIEPPGWQNRSTQSPIDAIPLDLRANVRDVFTGRHSISHPGDESDWVDEDEDIPAFAGGLGQISATVSSGYVPHNSKGNKLDSPTMTSVGLSRSRSAPTKRVTRGLTPGNTNPRPPKLSPISPTLPLPTSTTPELSPSSEQLNSRGGRRQLPSGRSGPAFRGHAIQEEDEDEE